jgi:hypothetical protein
MRSRKELSELSKLALKMDVPKWAVLVVLLPILVSFVSLLLPGLAPLAASPGCGAAD